ncbi:MAG: hypothetical protein LBN39_08685 [Planctomycetaceae bacterium]|jgi:hypothetical protein|nr:hypothetical protein [Planctomycetaceae bacterium]
MRFLLSLAVLFSAVSFVCADEPANEGRFLTKSEFDEFVRQYQTEKETAPKPGKCLAWQKGDFKFTLYGYVNLSASYDTEKVLSGDYVAYAYSPEKGDGASFQVDAKSSRFGVMIDSPGIPGWSGSKTQGCFEYDFQGAFSVRSRPGFMMRKAYVAVSDKYTKFLAGQDWEVISPLYPMTLNYTASACVGNNGYRRAMLKLDKRYDLTSSSDILFQFALTDNVLRDAMGVAWVSSHTGSYPVIQGRIAYAFAKNRGKVKPVTAGISAHISEQRFRFLNGTPETKYMKTWSLNADLDVPFSERFRIQAEWFTGENLGGTEGGILQGVDIYRRDTIRANGGWVSAQYFWTKKLQNNVCFAVDDPLNKDILGGNAADGQSRTFNRCIFVNALYNWTPALMTGFEVSFWKTNWQRYNGAEIIPMQSGEPTRFEFVTRYTF